MGRVAEFVAIFNLPHTKGLINVSHFPGLGRGNYLLSLKVLFLKLLFLLFLGHLNFKILKSYFRYIAQLLSLSYWLKTD